MKRSYILFALSIAVPLALGATAASADDTLKMVMGQINNWENQSPTLGQDAGIFKKHDILRRNVGTAGAGETIQAVISGSADLGGGVGVAGALRAYVEGRAGPHSAARLHRHQRSLLVCQGGFAAQDRSRIRPTRTRSPIRPTARARTISCWPLSTNSAPRPSRPRPAVRPARLTAVMSGQVDIGWAAPPFGLQEMKDGKIRILARGSDVPSLQGQTVRAIIVNAESLKTKQRRHHAVRRSLPRRRRLDVCRSEGDGDVRGQDQSVARDRQAVGR